MERYMDITLPEVAIWYMNKKKIKLTTGNLFWVMHKILIKVDYINKNKAEKIIKFMEGYCRFAEK